MMLNHACIPLIAEASEGLQILNAILGFLTVLLTPLVAVLIARLSAKVAETKAVAEKAVAETQAGNKTVAKVEASQAVTNERIDGMQTALIDAIGGRKKAEGKLEGIASEQTRIAGDISEIKTNGGDHDTPDGAQKVVAVVKAEQKKQG